MQFISSECSDVNYEGSEFIGESSSVVKFNFANLLKAALSSCDESDEQTAFYGGDKVSVFDSTASSGEKPNHHFNSVNNSMDNCPNNFMQLQNSNKYAIEEISAETSLGSQSPVESTGGNTTEEKEKVKTESGQSIYKNKYKEAFEQAKALLDEVLKLGDAKLIEIIKEAAKEGQVWVQDGEDMRPKLREFEEKERRLDAVKSDLELIQSDLKRDKSISNDLTKVKKTIKELRSKSPKNEKEIKKSKKQLDKAMTEELTLLAEAAELKKRLPNAKSRETALKKEQKELVKTLEGPKGRLLDALKVKKLARFAPICEILGEIKKHVTKDKSMDYFDNYKVKRSMKYFESHMADEELFYWILLIKIVLLLIPQDKAFLQLLPLKKETVSFMFWMIDSPIMKLKHKNLFKESYVRAHLRTEFTRVCNTLVFSAKKKFEEGKWSNEKWALLQKILIAGEDIPELYVNTSSTAIPSPAATHTPTAQDVIFSSESYEEVAGKRLFEEVSFNFDSNETIFDYEPEKKVYYGCDYTY